MFQSTHPHGVRPAAIDNAINSDEFQSTHPHGVRPEAASRFANQQIVFQSTHPHGVRLFNDIPDIEAEMFQSTHPHGVRRPARTPRQRRFSCFNPRTHTGCDVPRHPPPLRDSCFNPRTHTGCDSIVYKQSGYKIYGFNPRTHTGCDKDVRNHIYVCPVSIHAPTRGATKPCAVVFLRH